MSNESEIIPVNTIGDSCEIRSYDYKPFGDTLSTNADLENRLGFIGREKDFENNYFSFGPRNYAPETGLFLSCDPLFEQFDKLTPFHYAFNSPLQWKDPSGLSAEDEKGDKVQIMLDEDWFERNEEIRMLGFRIRGEYNAETNPWAWLLGFAMTHGNGNYIMSDGGGTPYGSNGGSGI